MIRWFKECIPFPLSPPGLLSILPSFPLTLTLSQIRLHTWGLHLDHRVHLPDSHTGGDSAEVCQPHLLHPVLQELFHHLALDRNLFCLFGNSDVHRSMEQPETSAGPQAKRRREEARVIVNTIQKLVACTQKGDGYLWCRVMKALFSWRCREEGELIFVIQK